MSCRFISWLAAVRFRIFRLISENVKTKVYRTVILCDLNECGTWPFTLREKHKRRVCGNGVLRAIFGRTREEVTGRLRKEHNEELRDLCC
jgi:hypothetical protein